MHAGTWQNIFLIKTEVQKHGKQSYWVNSDCLHAAGCMEHLTTLTLEWVSKNGIMGFIYTV